jgi:flavin-binding protein dodecin
MESKLGRKEAEIRVWYLLPWAISRMESKLGRKEAEIRMSVARVTELSATSETSFEDAINEAVARATKTLRGVEGAWVKDMNVSIEDGNIKGYRVNLEITFMLDE